MSSKKLYWAYFRFKINIEEVHKVRLAYFHTLSVLGSTMK